jgi:heme exporter protein B
MIRSLYIAAKDLRAELRTKQVLNSMLVFSLVVMVIFSLSLSDVLSDSSAVDRLAPGLLWIAFIFAGTLGITRTFASETENGCLEGLRLCPVESAAIYTGKVISSMCLMLMMEIATVPVFIVLFNYSIPGIPVMAIVILLGTAGFSAVGTLLSALTVNTRTREILLPVILLPLLVPVLIPAVLATGKILAGHGIMEIITELRLMGVYDIVFFTLARLLFDHTMEG